MAPFRGAALLVAAYATLNLLPRAFVAPRQAATPRTGRVARRVDESGCVPGGPLIVYMQALMDASAQKGESVPVTKDVMKYKRAFEIQDTEFMETMAEEINAEGVGMLDKARFIVDQMGPWESTVFPKFVKFLAKKQRFDELLAICEEYVAHLYVEQSIAPVTVTSAQRLTDEQAETIKEKMKARLGVSDVKLIQEVDGSLLGGFKLEWGYVDPDALTAPSAGMDLSLKQVLASTAAGAGVAM